MMRYLQRVKEMSVAFRMLEVQQIPRSENTRADVLSHLATSGATDHSRWVFVECL